MSAPPTTKMQAKDYKSSESTMNRRYWKLPLLILFSGAIASFAQKAQADDSTLAQVVRGCQFGGFPKYFSEVTTNGDPLRVRATPNGQPIGLIPDGWQVVVLEWSRNGVWARVTNHFSIDYPRFASAPDFREGWVSAGYLKDLGRFCDKPANVGQLLQPEVFGAQPIEVQGDWVALADRLAETVSAP